MITKLLPIFLLIATLIPVSASPIVKVDQGIVADVEPYSITTSGLITSYQVVYGQDIQVTAKVSVASNSPVPLNGFKAKIVLYDSDGSAKTPVWITVDNTLQPGQYGTFYFKTGIKADKYGDWDVYLNIYTKDDTNTAIAHDHTTFTVISEKPNISVEITDVVGYAAAGSAIMLAAYMVLRRI